LPYTDTGTKAGTAVAPNPLHGLRWQRHKPLLGKRLVHELRPGDVERAFADICAGRTRSDVKTKLRGRAIVKGGAGTGRKAIRLFGAACAWAMRERMVESNPAAGVHVGNDESRDVILDVSGYKAMADALRRLEAEGEVSGPVADAIRVIALTGARRGEIVRLRKEYVHMGRGRIRQPQQGQNDASAFGRAASTTLSACGRT
ncbi:MAG: hypothetical protein WD942_00235, partial [Dehalococcoidia bacterium]